MILTSFLPFLEEYLTTPSIKVKDILKAEGISNIKIRQDKRKENVWELRIRKQSEVAKAYRKLYLGSEIYLDRKKYKLFNLLKEASTTTVTPS